MSKKSNDVATGDVDLYTVEAHAEITHVDPVLVKTEFAKLPGLVARWNAIYADAHEKMLEAKFTMERTEARLSIEWRDQLSRVGKATEQGVKDRVLCDDRYAQARLAFIEADADAKRARAVCIGLDSKREALMSIGATMRKEMDDPTIRDQVAGQGWG